MDRHGDSHRGSGRSRDDTEKKSLSLKKPSNYEQDEEEKVEDEHNEAGAIVNQPYAFSKSNGGNIFIASNDSS